MTNPAILETLAKAMNGPHLPVPIDGKHTLSELRNVKWQNIGKGGRQNFLNQAAAVLEMVGPKPLVWEPSTCLHLVWVCQGTTTNQYRIALDDIVNEYSVLIDGCLNWHNTLEAAQAAAQAHADAAHWNNTKLGDML